MDLKQLHQLKCELLKVYRYQGLTLQELLCEFYSHINEVINSTNGLIDIVDYLVGEGLSNEVATHLNQMLIDGTFDKIISNKVDELSTNLNNQFNELKKIIESNISESDKLIENLRVYDSRFNNIESKNIEQDIRLKEVERVNKTQQVYIDGLFNENKDGRLSIEGEGIDLKLEGSKQGLVEVERIVGNTLVNLSVVPHLYKFNTGLQTSPSWVQYRVPLNNMLKPSTEYTFVLDVLENTLSSNLSFCGYGEYCQFEFNSSMVVKPGVCGRFIYKVITKADFSNIRYGNMYQFGQEFSDGEYVLFNEYILEGDYTNKPIPSEVFNGLQSSFESNLVTQEMVTQGLESAENLGKYKVPVRLVGKNLFGGQLEMGDISDSTGKYQSYPADVVRCATPIKIKPNTKYVFNRSFTVAPTFTVTYFYDKDMKLIKIQNMSEVNTSPSNACYMSFKIQNANNITSLIQIEEGTVSSEFEEYFERTTNVYLNSPLLEGDEIVMKDGELCHYHECINILLDGTQRYIDALPHNLDNNIAYIQIYDYDSILKSNSTMALSSNFKNVGAFNSDTQVDNYCVTVTYTAGKLRITLPVNVLSSITVFGVNEYFKSNPTNFICLLAEPWYEPIQADKLLLECANDSTLHIESIVPVENIVASYTGNVPSVYALEETGITNTEDISVTQTAVDFLLMSSMGEVMMISFLNNVKGINNLGTYFASRIIKKALSYEDVINKYPQFKNDIDTILVNEGYEYLIK